MVSLSSHLHRLVKVFCSNGEDHEFLEGEGVSGVRTSIDDVESGARENVRRLDSCELSEMGVERDSLQGEERRKKRKKLVSSIIDQPHGTFFGLG